MKERPISLEKIISSPKVESGEEIECLAVKNNAHYSFDVFNKKAIVVLPTNPIKNFTVSFSDQTGSTRAFPVIIHRNGNKIMGENEHMICDVPNSIFRLTFVGGYMGWFVTPENLST